MLKLMLRDEKLVLKLLHLLHRFIGNREGYDAKQTEEGIYRFQCLLQRRKELSSELRIIGQTVIRFVQAFLYKRCDILMKEGREGVEGDDLPVHQRCLIQLHDVVYAAEEVQGGIYCDIAAADILISADQGEIDTSQEDDPYKLRILNQLGLPCEQLHGEVLEALPHSNL